MLSSENNRKTKYKMLMNWKKKINEFSVALSYIASNHLKIHAQISTK